jgi:quercetin dioxygenase-like cupin family protein
MATRTFPAADVPTEKPERILDNGDRGGEISLLVANEGLSLTQAGRAAGERVTDPHVHEHAEAFYVLDGELAFQVGAERETITIGAGGFVAIPPGLAHSYRTAGDRPARWLIIHAPDGGFAAFMRGIRTGVRIDWDITPVPGDGGLPANQAIVSRPHYRQTLTSPACRRVSERHRSSTQTIERSTRCPKLS